MSSLVFDSVKLKGAADGAQGRLRVTSDGVQWSADGSSDTEPVKIEAADVGTMLWTNVHGGHTQLTCTKKEGGSVRFTGVWDGETFTKLEYFVKENYSLDLDKSKLATKGWNWGSPVFEGRTMSFQVDGKEAFDLPLEQVVQVTENKHEVALEINAPEKGASDDYDQLVEMRFLVPPSQATEDEDSDLTPAQKFLSNVRDRAKISEMEQGGGIVKFEQVNFVTPRGKYDMEMSEDFMTLRGQSYNYKVPYTQISRLFLLPRPGQTAISFVISVDPPIRQGKTGYQHLITQFPAHDELSVSLNMSDEDLTSKYAGKLEKEMSGPTYEVLTKVFKVLSKKRMSIPKGFRSARGDSCVRCAVGNQEGLLYVLDKSFMFVNKPAMHLRFEEIEHVDLDRTSEDVNRRALKSWDLTVALKGGASHTFANVEKNDYEPMVAFLKSCKIKLVGAHDPEEQKAAAMDMDDDDDEGDEGTSEDEDFDGAAPQESSSEDDDSDDDGEGVDEGEGGAGGDGEAKPKKAKAKRKTPDSSGSPKKKAKLKYGPKKPQTSYFMFIGSERAKVKEENPEASVTDIMKLLGARWGALGDGKLKYEEQAAADKVRYADELKQWQSDHPEEAAAMEAQAGSARAGTKKAKKEAKKANGGPKRGTTAYFFFTADIREKTKAENPEAKITDMAKIMGAKWKELTGEHKQKYVDLAEKDKQRYATEKAAWDIAHPEEAKAKPAPKKRAPKKETATAAAAAAAESDDDSDDDVSVDGDSDDDSE